MNIESSALNLRNIVEFVDNKERKISIYRSAFSSVKSGTETMRYEIIT